MMKKWAPGIICGRLADLEPYLDGDGGVWYPLRDVVSLLGQPDSERVTRHIIFGRRMKRLVGTDWRMRRHIHYIDGVALIEVCRALGLVPNSEVRAFVLGQSEDRHGGGKVLCGTAEA